MAHTRWAMTAGDKVALRQAARSGFVCAPNTLNSDPWLSELRKHSDFESLLTTAETLVEEARLSFDAYAAYYAKENID